MVEGKASEMETQKTVDNHKQVVFDFRVRNLMQMFDSLVVKTGCCVEFENILTCELQKVLKDNPEGNFTESEIEEISRSIYDKMKQHAQEMSTDPALRIEFIKELSETYRRYPDFIHCFDESINLDDLICTDKPKGIIPTVRTLWFSLHRYLTRSDERPSVNNFKSDLLSIPKTTIREENIESYEVGLTNKVCKKIMSITENVKIRSRKLNPDTKKDIHVCIQQLFYAEIEKIQNIWDLNHKPLSILERNQARYISEIKNKLKYGFCCASEGISLSEKLKTAIVLKATNAENNSRIQSVKDIIWTTNSEKVRLKFLSDMVNEVSVGNKRNALKFFDNPKKELEKWYIREVDN